MPSLASWSGRRIAAVSVAWLLLVLAIYWPLWYEVQLWWANYRPQPAGAMQMTYLDIEVTPGPAAYLLCLLLVLLVPAILLRLRAQHRRAEPFGGHLTLR